MSAKYRFHHLLKISKQLPGLIPLQFPKRSLFPQKITLCSRTLLNFTRRSLLLVILTICYLSPICIAESNADSNAEPPIQVRDIYTPELNASAQSLRRHLSQTSNLNERRSLLLKIAGLEYSMEQFKKARATLLLIEKTCSPSNPVGKAALLQHLGTCSLSLRNRSQARDYYQQALDILPIEESNARFELRILQQLCTSLSADSEPDRIISLLNRELDLCFKLKDRLSIGWAQLAMSDAYHSKGDAAKRDSFFEKAMFSFKKELANEEEDIPDAVPSNIWEVIEAGPQRSPARMWKSETKPKAILLCVHGLGLHSGHYHDFGVEMAKHAVNVIAMDVRGFGAWSSVSGKNEVDLEGAIHDLAAVARFTHKLNPGVPVFLLGESMGGAIVLHTSARYPEIVDGVISSVPAADRYNSAETMGKLAWHFLVKRNRDYDVSSDIIKRVSEKEHLRSDWEADRFARFKMAPLQLIAFDRFMKSNLRIAAGMKRPALVTQGDQDQLVKADSTIKLFRALGTDDKNLLLLGNGEHLIFEKGQFDSVLIDSIMGWIAAHSNT